MRCLMFCIALYFVLYVFRVLHCMDCILSCPAWYAVHVLCFLASYCLDCNVCVLWDLVFFSCCLLLFLS